MTHYRDWVQQAQSTNTDEKHQAFDALMQQFRPMAYQVAYGTLQDSQLAEDATQDAFLTAYKQINKLRDPLAFPGWLKRIVWTHCDRLIRGKQPIIEPIDIQFDLADNLPTPETALEAEELRHKVQTAIDALPEHERDVTAGFYLKGESQKELSERLNLPLATVKKRLQYARANLRGIISGFNDTIDRAFYGTSTPQPQPVPIYTRHLNHEDEV